jgi:membrane associated rhomboid family serine protease
VCLLAIILSTALRASAASLGEKQTFIDLGKPLSYPKFRCDVADLYGLMHGQLWRVVTSFLVFQNSAQIIVGLILLYTCRQFERQMGSKKFGAFLVFSVFVSTLIGLAIIVAAWSIGFYLVPSPGPFPLIFALMTYYFCKYLYFHITPQLLC